MKEFSLTGTTGSWWNFTSCKCSYSCNTPPFAPPHLLPQLTLVHQTLQLVCQVAIFVAQLVVSDAVLLDLSLDLHQFCLEVVDHLRLPLLVISAALDGLLLWGAEGGGPSVDVK